jgi:hypothetical protein
MGLTLSRLDNAVREELFKDIDGFHKKLCVSVYIILTTTGALGEEEAKNWINQHLKPIP